MDRNNAMQIVIVVVNAVALRKESVDRNCRYPARCVGLLSSLSARRAWIEMNGLKPSIRVAVVALRKESVDRNDVIRPAIDVFLASLSARRAWIEIRCSCCPVRLLARRSPQGERG